ncbi:hypothetical protein [Paenibacillus sp. EPM92]|nr:hypothetical protein [Paenibacillus sp. EPM92]
MNGYSAGFSTLAEAGSRRNPWSRDPVKRSGIGRSDGPYKHGL